jgi:hypothetical protein
VLASPAHDGIRARWNRPFSRRGREPQDSDNDDNKTTAVPRASRPAKPGLLMPLTIEEYSYVIVDNGAANPGELAIGRVHKVDDELVDVHWHALKDASVPTPMQVWQPTWVGADGTLRTSDLPPRGRTAETGGCSMRRRPLWRGRTVRNRLQSTLTHDRMSSDFHCLVFQDHQVQQDEVIPGSYDQRPEVRAAASHAAAATTMSPIWDRRVAVPPTAHVHRQGHHRVSRLASASSHV